MDTGTTAKKSNWKSIFIKDDEIPQQKATTPQAPVAAPIYRSDVTSTRVDPSIQSKLQSALDGKQLDGFEYFKFKKAKDEMATIVSGEKAQFQSAFVSAKALGVTKDKLIDTAKHYLSVLDEELQEFNGDVNDKNKDEIGMSESRITQMGLDITAKSASIRKLQDDVAESIRKLQDEMAELQKQKSALSNEVADHKSKIEATKTSFIATYNTMSQGIKDDIEKMRTYL